MASTDYVQVVTTIDSRDRAEAIARALVDQRLAGCVQIIGPMSSVYRWQGAIQSAEEWQCLAKTRRDLFSLVADAIRRCHTYQVPEILALPVDNGDADYLDWLDGELRAK